MIISPITTNSLVTTSDGKAFIPTASITYIEAHYAFLRYVNSVDNSSNIIKEDYQRLPYVNHVMFTNWLSEWLNEKINGKFSFPQYNFTDKNDHVYFEDMQDAILFKIMFGK